MATRLGMRVIDVIALIVGIAAVAALSRHAVAQRFATSGTASDLPRISVTRDFGTGFLI
jgi:hypothetical protein